MKDVTIFDNFINDDEIIEINKMMGKLQWGIGYSLKNSNNTMLKMIIEEEHFKYKILNKLENLTNKKFEILRVYANGQNYVLDGEWHTDAEEYGSYTLLIYISDINNNNIKQMGGYTHFVLYNIIISVEPYKKRAVFFDSRILHKAVAPLNKDILRISIAFKLKEIK
tara:strand:- start:44 stop:544 length:501 start_codon:yes stop_codon:yes gene_type:complete